MYVGVLEGLQRALHQQFQLQQVILQPAPHGVVLDQVDPQAQAGDGGLEIVGDGPEHLIPVTDEALQASTHDVETTSNGNDFSTTLLT